MKLVFLLEEPSAARFLEQFLPRWNPGLNCGAGKARKTDS